MRETLILLTAPFAVWLIAAPWVDGDPSALGTLGGTIAGAALLVGVALAVRTAARPAAVALVTVLGAASVIFGAVAFPAGLAVRLAAAITGLAAVALSLAARAVPAPQHVVAVNKRGGTLAEIKSIRVRDGKIAAPSILLGSMPETVYVTPREVWNLLGNIGFDLVRALPAMVLRGRAEARAAEHPDAGAPPAP